MQSLLQAYKHATFFDGTAVLFFPYIPSVGIVAMHCINLFTKFFRLIIIPIILFLGIQAVLTGAIQNNEMDYSDDIKNNGTDEINPKSIGWMKSMKDMLSTPTGHVVTRVAKELLNRSTGNNQVRSNAVLSLNLTNLIIILLLKVLVFAAAFLGAGHLGYAGYGYNYARSSARSEDELNFGLSNGEDSIITAFLAAQGSGIDDCLYAAACSNPKISLQYTKAAKALIEGIKKFDSNSFQNTRYNDLINLMEKATYDGLGGHSCNTTVDCNNLI